jgi:hypothetical protein
MVLESWRSFYVGWPDHAPLILKRASVFTPVRAAADDDCHVLGVVVGRIPILNGASYGERG